MSTGDGAQEPGARRRHRWIDEDWRRDWLLWLGAVVALSNLVAGVVRETVPWWRLLLGVPYSFAFTVALVGFFRVVVRTYRAP